LLDLYSTHKKPHKIIMLPAPKV